MMQEETQQEEMMQETIQEEIKKTRYNKNKSTGVQQEQQQHDHAPIQSTGIGVRCVSALRGTRHARDAGWQYAFDAEGSGAGVCVHRGEMKSRAESRSSSRR